MLEEDISPRIERLPSRREVGREAVYSNINSNTPIKRDIATNLSMHQKPPMPASLQATPHPADETTPSKSPKQARAEFPPVSE